MVKWWCVRGVCQGGRHVLCRIARVVQEYNIHLQQIIFAFPKASPWPRPAFTPLFGHQNGRWLRRKLILIDGLPGGRLIQHPLSVSFCSADSILAPYATQFASRMQRHPAVANEDNMSNPPDFFLIISK